MTTRSIEVATGSGLSTTGSHLAYTVPSGHTLILKSGFFYMNVSGGGSLGLDVKRGSATAIPIMRTTLVQAVPQYFDWWIVLEPEDILNIVIQTASMSGRYWLSGSLLQGVAP